jgi:hypothetical protein
MQRGRGAPRGSREHASCNVTDLALHVKIEVGQKEELELQGVELAVRHAPNLRGVAHEPTG